MNTRLWKINCMEDRYPGMWQRWFKHQCVGVGWMSNWGYKLRGPTEGGRGWSRARRHLEEIQPGDHIVVSLKSHRIGRIGEVVRKEIEDDQWAPLVPPSRDLPDGEMGRRIIVRWDLETGPNDRELVVTLPEQTRFTLGELRPTIAEIRSQQLSSLCCAANDPTNWVGILSHFYHERSLSDYIGAYPHRLEDGLLPHPNEKVRERVFADHGRLDVLLLDRGGIPVIVECKQYQPSVKDIHQLQHYLQRLREETGKTPRGILVHGGSRKLRSEVRQAAEREPTVELVQYRVEVDFTLSH